MNYELKDNFGEELDRKGFAQIKETSYKAILFGDNDQPAIERVSSGHREIVVGNRGEKFISLDHAKLWAVTDAENRSLFVAC